MNKFLPFAIILFATLITSTAQIFYKLGVSHVNSLGILNYYLIFGILLYSVAAVLVIFAFKQGQVSMLYPLFATSYIWVSILSSYFFSEIFGMVKLLGIASIIAGVAFIGLDAAKIRKSEVA